MARRQNFLLDVATEQAVFALLANQAKEVLLLRSGLRGGDVPAAEIAAAGVDHLSLLHERFVCLPHFVPVGGRVDVMHLIEVDVIGLHSRE